MLKTSLLVVAGLTVGFVTSVDTAPARALSCMSSEIWAVTLVDASPEIDRAAWAFEATYLSNHALYANGHFELTLVAR